MALWYVSCVDVLNVGVTVDASNSRSCTVTFKMTGLHQYYFILPKFWYQNVQQSSYQEILWPETREDIDFALEVKIAR